MGGLRREIDDLQRVVRAERASRRGFLASLALTRFVRVYRKYDPDQPRDDRGRWAETGSGEDDPRAETTGATAVRRYRTGDPTIDAVTEVLENAVADAMEQAGPGSGPAYGTKVHELFARGVVAADIPGIRQSGVEVTLLLGEPSPYGAEDSVRTDVLLRSRPDATGSVVAIWDLKTGSATLSPSRAGELRRGAGVGLDVPVIELHAIKGVSVKAILSRTEV